MLNLFTQMFWHTKREMKHTCHDLAWPNFSNLELTFNKELLVEPLMKICGANLNALGFSLSTTFYRLGMDSVFCRRVVYGNSFHYRWGGCDKVRQPHSLSFSVNILCDFQVTFIVQINKKQ